MLLATKLILIATLFGNVIVLILLSRERRTLLTSIFFIYILAITGWTGAILINLWTHSLFVEKSIFAFATIFLVAQFWFAKLFPEKKLPAHIFEYWSLAVGAFFLGASLWDNALYHAITVHPEGYTTLDNGPLMTYYSLFATAYVIAPVVFLIRKWRRAQDPSLRMQLHFLTIGFTVFLFVNILTNMILPVFYGIYFFNAIGPIFSLVLAVAVFYIIWRYRFLDIRVVVERGIVYLLLFTLLIGSYFGALPVLERLAISIQIMAPAFAFFLMVIGIFMIYRIERSFERASLLEQERAYAATLEQKVAQRTAHLADLQAQQTRMLGDISHALQTPLTVLKGSLNCLLNDPNTAPTHAHAIEHSVDDISTFVYDLLRLSRLEALPPSPHVRIDMSALTLHTAEYVETICRDHSIELAYNIAPDITVTGNEKELRELITILLSNAVRYTKISAIKTITITLQRTVHGIELSVADTGIGIPADKLPHIFERFYRAHEDTGERGNGLGLTIAKKIAENHIGTIEVKSTEGSGSIFTVRFLANESQEIQ